MFSFGASKMYFLSGENDSEWSKIQVIDIYNKVIFENTQYGHRPSKVFFLGDLHDARTISFIDKIVITFGDGRETTIRFTEALRAQAIQFVAGLLDGAYAFRLGKYFMDPPLHHTDNVYREFYYEERNHKKDRVNKEDRWLSKKQRNLMIELPKLGQSIR